MLPHAPTYVDMDNSLHAKSLPWALTMSGEYLAQGRNATVDLFAAFTFLLVDL